MDGARTEVLAVLVLYGRGAEESESFASLRSILLRAGVEAGGWMKLLVYDNSPGAAGAVPELPIEVRVVADPRNGGVAAAYGAGLEQARREGVPWLMLLDQDTVLTEDYVAELREVLGSDGLREDVVALVPQLVHGGVVHSPTRMPRLSHRALRGGAGGVSTERLSVFNSGAVMRVSAVLGAGGFPARFWLDFLDHAVFGRLQACGGRIWVMRARLEHELSTMKLRAESLSRYKNMLFAERDFYRLTGGADRMWYRLRRLKQSLGLLLKVRDKRFAGWSARAAVGWLPATPKRD